MLAISLFSGPIRQCLSRAMMFLENGLVVSLSEGF